jgi:hypothetical protein
MKILPRIDAVTSSDGENVSIQITIPPRLALVIAGFLPGLCREILGDIPEPIDVFCSQLRREGLR